MLYKETIKFIARILKLAPLVISYDLDIMIGKGKFRIGFKTFLFDMEKMLDNDYKLEIEKNIKEYLEELRKEEIEDNAESNGKRYKK